MAASGIDGIGLRRHDFRGGRQDRLILQQGTTKRLQRIEFAVLGQTEARDIAGASAADGAAAMASDARTLVEDRPKAAFHVFGLFEVGLTFGEELQLLRGQTRKRVAEERLGRIHLRDGRTQDGPWAQRGLLRRTVRVGARIVGHDQGGRGDEGTHSDQTGVDHSCMGWGLTGALCAAREDTMAANPRGVKPATVTFALRKDEEAGRERTTCGRRCVRCSQDGAEQRGAKRGRGKGRGATLHPKSLANPRPDTYPSVWPTKP